MSDLNNAGVIWNPPSLWGSPHPAPAVPGATGATGPVPPPSATGATGNPFLNSNPQFIQPPTTTGATGALDPNILNSMQQFTDAAYANQQRELDPQWQQQRSAFDQKMVGQGLMPGSEAYNNAYQNFSRSQNDAYNQARNTSQQQGLAAQQQGWAQHFGYDQLANALAIAQQQSAGQMGAAGISANASMYNNDANNATNQLLGLGNLGLGYGNLQQQGSQNDMQNLMAMLGYGQGQDQYNNGLIGGDINTLLGLVPNSNPSQVDVNGAYGINQSGANTQYQGQVASANSTNQTAGAVGSAALMAAIML